MSNGVNPKMMLVVGAIVVDDLDAPTRVLAARRSGPPELKGKWEFPGGKVEEDEGPEEALLRELREELGTEAGLGDELPPPSGKSWHISDDLEMRLWYVEIIGGEPTPIDSHDELKWLCREDLHTVDWLEADNQALPFVFR